MPAAVEISTLAISIHYHPNNQQRSTALHHAPLRLGNEPTNKIREHCRLGRKAVVKKLPTSRLHVSLSWEHWDTLITGWQKRANCN
jgi:hypothetical protein